MSSLLAGPDRESGMCNRLFQWFCIVMVIYTDNVIIINNQLSIQMKAGDFEWTVGTLEVFTNYIKRTFILSVKGQAKQNREITQVCNFLD